MNNIAFNINISPMLKVKVSVALGVLPFGLMFASFIPTWFIFQVIAGALGISLDGPVRDHENGTFGLALFLFVAVVLMITVYLFGWLLNALISH
jgi:hypothetical protein